MAFCPSNKIPSENQEFDLLRCSEVKVGRKEEEVPIGYRFKPEDDVLILFFLVNKILGRALPITDCIKEIDLYEHDPDHLPVGDYRHGLKRNEAFYFTNLRQIYTSEGKIIKRQTRTGHWKVTGREREVKYGKSNVILGFKLSMVFHKGQPPAPRGSISRFVMHQYRVNPSIFPVDLLNDTIRAKIEKFVVCKIINRTHDQGTSSELPLNTPEFESVTDEEESD